MSTDFEYRKYNPGDEKGIVDLLKTSFPKWTKRSVEFWKWKYIDSSKDPSVYVALEERKVIGVISNIPLEIKLGDKIVNAIYSDDTAIDPNYRGRGVYSKLLKHVRSDLDRYGPYFSYWATEKPILTKSLSYSGSYLFPFPISHMIKIKDINKYLKNRNKDEIKNNIAFGRGIEPRLPG